MTQMFSSSADVVTERPQRFAKQLVSHLGRRHGGTWDDATQAGQITFPQGEVLLSCQPGLLELRLHSEPAAAQHAAEAADTEVMEDPVGWLEGVVERHLVRFGSRDELEVTWVRPS